MLKIIRSIGVGFAISILFLEIILQFLPVTTESGYMKTTQSELMMRSNRQSVKYSLDWKFHQAQTRQVNNYGFVDDQDYQQNSSPIAVIGDSYIQSLMLPYSSTLQGQLSALLNHHDPVYSFGIPAYSFAGYIASAEYASRTFQPQAFVFLLTKADITDSLVSKTTRSYGIDPDNLQLIFKPFIPSQINQLLSRSALMRYLSLNLGFQPVAKPTVAKLEPTYNISQLSTQLLNHLERKSTVSPQNTIFILDCDRERIYQPNQLTPVDDQLTIFAQIAQQRGYRIVDTQPLFVSQYQKSHRRLDFTPIDRHWNQQAHQLVARIIAPLVEEGIAGRNQ